MGSKVMIDMKWMGGCGFTFAQCEETTVQARAQMQKSTSK